MIPTGFQELMSRFGILAGAVVNLEDGTKAVVGDRTRLQSDYLMRTLFDDLPVSEINEYLQGQLLPRMAQQGKVCGVVCKPNSSTIVGLYYHDERDVIHRYGVSKELDAAVRKLWQLSQ